MSFEWLSYFECPVCGTVRNSGRITYDPLGYPICPTCRGCTRPSPRTAAGRSIGRTG